MIEIETPDGLAEAYLARPDDAEHPGVLFLMDAFGLRPRIEEMADRIASWGYVVLAPNLFYRDGRADDLAPTADLREPGTREEFFKAVMPRIRGLTAGRVKPDLSAYFAALRELPGVAEGPFGVTGYCMGGRLSLVAACAFPALVAAAGDFHGGRLATDSPDSPHHALPQARATFVFGHADNDGSMTTEDIARLEAALDDAGLTYTSAVYAGALHGYTMSDTSMYDEAASERHFTELKALLDQALS
ncbi:MAG: dienelactone hydrolase family protein [Marmoricola sp.]